MFPLGSGVGLQVPLWFTEPCANGSVQLGRGSVGVSIYKATEALNVGEMLDFSGFFHIVALQF